MKLSGYFGICASLTVLTIPTHARAIFGMTSAQYDDVYVGSIFNISWSQASGPITLTLENGENNVLTPYITLASEIAATQLIWPIPATVKTAHYVFAIDDGSGAANINYSPLFLITGLESYGLLTSGSNVISPTTVSSVAPADSLLSTTRFTFSSTTVTLVLSGSASRSLQSLASTFQTSSSISPAQTSSTFSSTSTKKVTTTVTKANANPTSVSTTKKSRGRSKGALAGIGIGAALGLVFIIVLGILLVRYGKRSVIRKRESETGTESNVLEKAELDSGEQPSLPEKDGLEVPRRYAELDESGAAMPGELSDGRKRDERTELQARKEIVDMRHELA